MAILDLYRLDGRVAIVTGAGRGIGAACALALAEAGADVVIAARSSGQLEAVAAAVGATGRTARAVPADLADLGQAARLVAEARDAFGRLDIIVNNVGGAVPRPFLETSADDIEQAVHFNVGTAHALLRSAVQLMLHSGGGAVINMSSIAGLAPGLHASTPNLAAALSGEIAVGGTRKGRLRNLLVVLQVTACTV